MVIAIKDGLVTNCDIIENIWDHVMKYALDIYGMILLVNGYK